MYDPYPPRPTLRLGLDLQAVKSRHEERADIRRQIESLLVRHCELTMLIDAEHAQSQPIPISDSVSGSFTVPASAVSLGGGTPTNAVLGVVTAVHPDGNVSIRLGDNNPTIARQHTDNDFWTHRHRVMGGENAMIARATGQVEILREDDGA